MAGVTESTIFSLAQRPFDCSSLCPDCSQRHCCPAFDLHSAGITPHNEAHNLTQNVVRAGQTVINAGERFSYLYMTRSGFFKSTFMDSNGDIQITGFHFPGELFGFEGIDTCYHSTTVEALETGSICRIPLSVLLSLTHTVVKGPFPQNDLPQGPGMLSLFKVMGGIIARDRAMIFSLGKMSARRRLATFLVDISNRMQRSGYDGDEFRLCMSRTDMANHLCLAIETISRLFTQLNDLDIINIERRHLRIVDRDALLSIVADNHPETVPM